MRKQAFHLPGFSVLVPEQEFVIRVRSYDVKCEDLLPMKFECIRAIGRFDFIDENGEVIQDQNNWLMEFKVGYTFDDVWKAGCFRDLKLFFHNGSDWKEITEADNEYILFPPSTASYAEFKINFPLADPTLAWGK